MRPLLFGFLLIATGCATPQQGVIHTTSHGSSYWNPVESGFSRRLDGLSSQDVLGHGSVMRDALIAGNDDLYVACALFEQEGYLTMDMIVLNRSDEPVRIDREDLRLVTADGVWLQPVDDWTGSEKFGLRAKQSSGPGATYLYEAPEYAPVSDPSQLGFASSGFGLPVKSPSVRRAAAVRRPVSGDAAWRGGLGGRNAPAAPDRLTVQGEDGKAYWTYWDASAVDGPVTAFLMLEGSHMIFQFEPGAR